VVAETLLQAKEAKEAKEAKKAKEAKRAVSVPCRLLAWTTSLPMMTTIP
jgi:hypothetical protein